MVTFTLSLSLPSFAVLLDGISNCPMSIRKSNASDLFLPTVYSGAMLGGAVCKQDEWRSKKG